MTLVKRFQNGYSYFWNFNNAFISFRHLYCIAFSYVSFNHVEITVLTFIQSVYTFNLRLANTKSQMRDARE